MTLKVRLLIAMGLVAGFLVAAAFTVTRTTTDYLVDQVDRQLVRLSGPADSGPALPPANGGAPAPPATGGGSDQFSTFFIGVFDSGELTTRVAPTAGPAEGAVPLIGEDAAVELARAGEPTTVASTSDGTRYRVAARVSSDGELVVVGLQLDDVDAAISRLITVQLVAVGAVLIVLGLITWWVLRLGVRPIRRMTAAATEIADGDRSGRIPDAPAGTEAAELGTALNTMLERLQQSFDEQVASEERLRRFLADASHELRTPVTTIRGYAELHRMGGLDDREQLDLAMRRTEAEAVRMGRLVDDMLTLARLDRGQTPQREAVDVARVVADAVADLQVVHPDRIISVDLDDAVVEADAHQVHQVVANLLNNAAVHTPAGTPIDVTVECDEGVCRTIVADHGPGMDDETAARAFERFYRADPSRSRASGGSGLGLPIVAAIVAAHGGSVRIVRATDDPTVTGTAVVVELPLARQPVAAS